MKCPCCDKPINAVEEIEPIFGLPDRIIEVPPSLRSPMLGSVASTPPSAQALVGRDVCVLRGEPRGRPTSRWAADDIFYLRVVLPVGVVDRPGQPCNWGVWVEVAKDVAVASALQGGEAEVPLEDVYMGKLANDIGVRLDQAPLLGAPLFVIPDEDPAQRWSALLTSAVEHPFAEEQFRGVTRARMLEWTRPWHHLVGN